MVAGAIASGVRGVSGRITLDRPEKLNALTPGMVEEFAALLAAWENDDAVRLVVVDGAGERGLCAGGDLRLVMESRAAGDGRACRFWASEYRLNAAIAAYRKPIVAFMTGIVMGGGVGVSAHGRHRIVTETTRLAMPEVRIGIIPDVGGTWLLAHAPGELGTYVALTGAALSGSDAIALGLADHFVREAALPALREALEGLASAGGMPCVPQSNDTRSFRPRPRCFASGRW